MGAKGAKRSVTIWTTNFYESFSKSILLYMNGQLSKIRLVHTYIIPRTVYFDWICIPSADSFLRILNWWMCSKLIFLLVLVLFLFLLLLIIIDRVDIMNPKYLNAEATWFSASNCFPKTPNFNKTVKKVIGLLLALLFAPLKPKLIYCTINAWISLKIVTLVSFEAK